MFNKILGAMRFRMYVLHLVTRLMVRSKSAIFLVQSYVQIIYAFWLLSAVISIYFLIEYHFCF